jgi:hypothetical protein
MPAKKAGFHPSETLRSFPLPQPRIRCPVSCISHHPENAYASDYQLLTNYALKAEGPIGIFARLYGLKLFLVY